VNEKRMKAALHFLIFLVAVPLRVVRHAWRRGVWRARGARVASTAELRTGPGGSIELATDTSIGSGTLLIAESQEAGVASRLVVGRGTAINEYCNLRAAGGDIVIGENCLLAQFVSVIASNHGTTGGVPILEQPWDRSSTGVRIGNDVWVGANTVLLPGVTVHDGAVIAAGAVVTCNVPSEEIWGGIPARRISMRKKST
jgi:acetyltransferase-like isoleucine patch superfamily enzyme